MYTYATRTLSYVYIYFILTPIHELYGHTVIKCTYLYINIINQFHFLMS